MMILFAGSTKIFCKDPLHLKPNVIHIEVWCLASKLILHYTKTFQVVVKAPNEKILNPEEIELTLGNYRLGVKICTTFLGIHKDSQILFREHVSEVIRKLNFALLLMRCTKPYLDNDTTINIYFTFFYPEMVHGIEIYWHVARCHLDQISILQSQPRELI